MIFTYSSVFVYEVKEFIKFPTVINSTLIIREQSG